MIHWAIYWSYSMHMFFILIGVVLTILEELLLLPVLTNWLNILLSSSDLLKMYARQWESFSE